MTKITDSTVRRYKRLSDVQQTAVQEIVRRHLAACKRQRIDPESLEQVWTDAMAVVERGLDEGEGDNDGPCEPIGREVRRYRQYESPRDLRI